MDIKNYYHKGLEEKGKKVIKLLNSTPDGVVHDADTILADFMEDVDFKESGIASEIIDIWTKSIDRYSVEKLFCLMTGVAYEDYLDICIRDTTRADGADTQMA